MRRILFAISVMVVVAAIFVYCSQGSLDDKRITESETGKESTTVIVDNEGSTHYYKVVSNNAQETDSITVLAEIATDKNGEPITNHSGEYVTMENTTVIKPETTTSAPDDNDVSFDNTDESSTAANTESTKSETSTSIGNSTNSTTSIETTSKTEPTTPAESPTDSEGWINRWY
jgi:hypothetical protein